MVDVTEKIKQIDEIIQRIDAVVEKNDNQAAHKLCKEIIGIYGTEIDSIMNMLDMTTWHFDEHPIDYIGDARLLKGKLLNYRTNLSSGLYSVIGNPNGVHVSQNVNQRVSNNIEVTLDSTVSIINRLPSDSLSDEEKDILNGKLAAINAAQDKPTRWERAKNALKWIAEKSIEVGIAALPYIVEALKK